MSVTVCGLDGCVFWLVCGLGESSSVGGGGHGGWWSICVLGSL